MIEIDAPARADERIAALEAKVAMLTQRVKDLTADANRWQAVRRNLSLLWRRYCDDSRHDLPARRRDEGQIADDAADRIREG